MTDEKAFMVGDGAELLSLYARLSGADEPLIAQQWIPGEISDTVAFTSPQQEGGSDHSAFTCAGAPVIRLQSHYPEYRQYTWHTNRDTFDKISFDDLRNNATLTAMLAYMASEDPERVPRDRMVVPDEGTRPGQWPRCGNVRRSWSEGQPR